MTTDPAAPPPEPEIELLGRVAGRFLWLVRRALWLAGAVALAYGAWRSGHDAGWTFVAPYSLLTLPDASGVVWWCAGLPLVVRTDWLFGRGRWWALGLGASLCFGAVLLPGDHAYGWVLRFFASLIACATLLVWRTVWGLTRHATPRP